MPPGNRRRSVVAKFVVLLTGLLTLLSTHTFDLGDRRVDPDEETAPLLNERVEDLVVQGRPMTHAVAVFDDWFLYGRVYHPVFSVWRCVYPIHKSSP
jgi:hypothetical protein